MTTPGSPARPLRTWADVKGVRAILLLALVKGLVLAWLIPPFQAPDEYGHYDYALYLSRVPPADFLLGRIDRPITLVQEAVVTREVVALAEATGTATHLSDAVLPARRDVADMVAAGAAWDDGQEHDVRRRTTWSGLMNYPPLYYAAAGTLIAAQRAVGVNPVVRYYSVRLFSLALFLLAIVAAAAALARLHTSELWKTTTLALIALQPQLSLLSVSAQPDLLGLLLVTAALAVLVDAVTRAPFTRAVALGALLGALALTKTHYVPPLVAAMAAALAWGVFTKRMPVAAAARWASASALVAIAVGGWWYVRSALLFGNWMGLTAWLPGPGGPTWLENLWLWWQISLPMTFRSYWGVWGWFDFGVEPWMIGPLMAVSLLPAMMLVLALLARAREDQLRVRPVTLAPSFGPWLVLVVAGLVFVVEMIAIGAAMGMVQGQGRHWLAFVLPQAMYLAAPVTLTGRAGALLVAWARLRRPLLATAGATALALAAVGSTASLARVPAGWLEVDVRVAGDGFVTVFADSGVGFNEAEHATHPVRRRDGDARLSFPLADAAVRRLRIDFTTPGDTATVANAALVDRRGARTPVSFARVDLPTDVTRLEPGPAHLTLGTGGRTTTIVEVALDQPVVLGQPWWARARQPAWEVWSRAWRRWPALQDAAVLWPTALVAAVLCLSLWREGRAGPIPRDTLWPVGLSVALAAIAGALNLWLAVYAWFFYLR